MKNGKKSVRYESSLISDKTTNVIVPADKLDAYKKIFAKENSGKKTKIKADKK